MTPASNHVRVSYLTLSSGPALWGSVGSIVTDPGEGRYAILRKLDTERGPIGYLVVDLCSEQIYGGLDTEKDARAYVAELAREAK